MLVFVHYDIVVAAAVDGQANEGYLQGQIGNPDGEEKPNKKFYDPRVWLRKVSKCCQEARGRRSRRGYGNRFESRGLLDTKWKYIGQSLHYLRFQMVYSSP